MEIPKLTGPFTYYDANIIVKSLQEDYRGQIYTDKDGTEFHIALITVAPYELRAYNLFSRAFWEVSNKQISHDVFFDGLAKYEGDEYTVVAFCKAPGNLGTVKTATLTLKETEINGSKLYSL